MREYLGIAIFLLIGGVNAVFAQVDTLWTCRLAAEGVPSISGAIPLDDGGVAVVGTLAMEEDSNLLVARISPAGIVAWQRSFGHTALSEIGSAVVELPNGDLLLAGGQSTTGGNSNILLLMGISASGDSLWSKRYFTGGQTKANDVVLLADGNVGVAGYRIGLDGAHSDMWLLKCNGSGDTLWTKTIGGGDTDAGTKISEAANGDLWIGGHSRSSGTGQFDQWLVRTNSAGDGLHSAFYGPTATSDRCAAMAVNDSGVYVGGYSLNPAESNYDGYLARANSAGEFLWGNAYTRGFVVEQIRGLVSQPGGGVMAVGWVGQSELDVKPWILTVHPDGQTATSRIDSSVVNGCYTGVLAIPNGGYYLYGNVVDGGQTKGYVMRTLPPGGVSGTVTNLESGDPLGGVKVSVIGNPAYGVTNAQGWFAISLLPGSYDLVAAGRCISPDTLRAVTVTAGVLTPVSLRPGAAVLEPCPVSSLNLVVHTAVADTTPFVVRNAGDGPMAFSLVPEVVSPASNWLRVVPSSGVVPPHGELTVGIRVEGDPENTTVWEYFGRLTMHANACPDSVYCLPVFVSVLDAPERPAGLPDAFAFHAPSPNPFNMTTRLSFDLPRAMPVKLALYDMTGRLARVLWDAPLAAGTHALSFDGAGLASGVYLARLDAGANSATQKLLLVK